MSQSEHKFSAVCNLAKFVLSRILTPDLSEGLAVYNDIIYFSPDLSTCTVTVPNGRAVLLSVTFVECMWTALIMGKTGEEEVGSISLCVFRKCRVTRKLMKCREVVPLRVVGRVREVEVLFSGVFFHLPVMCK